MNLASTTSPGGFIVIFAVAIGIIVWSILNARKRTQALTQLAPQLGFTFLGNAWSGPAFDPQHKTCLVQRSRGRFSNVMAGVAGDLEAIVFDYTYQAGKTSVSQTVACYTQKLPLPPFALKPEGLFDRIGDAIVHNDIDFESNPVFSKRYALKSPDEAGTRQLFTPSLLTYMEQIPADKKWLIEANAANLFVFRHGLTVSAADLPSFLQETSTIARTIFSSDGMKNRAGWTPSQK